MTDSREPFHLHVSEDSSALMLEGENLLEDQEDKLVQWIRKKRLLLGKRPGKDHKAIREKTLAMMRHKKTPCLTEHDMTLGIHWVRHLIERRPNLQVCERLVYVNLDGVIDETDSSDFEY